MVFSQRWHIARLLLSGSWQFRLMAGANRTTFVHAENAVVDVIVDPVIDADYAEVFPVDLISGIPVGNHLFAVAAANTVTAILLRDLLLACFAFHDGTISLFYY
jgi:hypothetical protein